jgi:ribonuclease-3
MTEARHGGLERALGYKFQRQLLLRRALTHKSYANESQGVVPDNETLEFLGDAVLEFVVRDLLLRRFPELHEGQLTQLKAVLVNAANLARHGERLGLGEHLYLGRGEDKERGRGKASLVADAFEAIIAAIYLDGGLRAARAFIQRCFKDQLNGLTGSPASLRDHKSLLQEQLQARGLPLPTYVVESEQGPDHSKTFTVAVRLRGERMAAATGRSKKEAQQLAAAEALALLKR